jgi:hypothetical protein
LHASLFRRNLIEESDLERQLEEIAIESQRIERRRANIANERDVHQAAAQQLATTEALLEQLPCRLDSPLSFEIKRQLVETLVDSVRVETVTVEGRKRAIIKVAYRFDSQLITERSPVQVSTAHWTGI